MTRQRKGKGKKKQRQMGQNKKTKVIDLNPMISTFTLNINGIKTPIKGRDC